MSEKELKHDIREFFGYVMAVLRERGVDRETRKRLVRECGLVDKCRTRHGAMFVLHYNVEDWCDYIQDPSAWGHKLLAMDKRIKLEDYKAFAMA